jgi:mannose-6-phosphate isomerase-like protein (cupin superfamily)
MTSRSWLPEVTDYITKDGSEIRELLHPNQHTVKNQSLAEARIPPGTRTIRHYHLLTEEIYHVTQGSGMMQLGEAHFPVKTGDSIAIAPGTAHCIENTGQEILHILCCCAPAYSHEDTVLLEG